MSKPNILLIHADQHRADCLGAAGNAQIRTPAMDALAGDGVLYENSYCAYPVCTPSRYSLISGLYVHQHLCEQNGSTLPDGLTTFPRLLRQAGYRTACVGKMHFTPAYQDVGFDSMTLCEQVGPGRLDDDFHRELKQQGLFDWVDTVDQMAQYRRQAPDFYWKSKGALESDLDLEHHSTTWIGDRAAEALEAWEGDGNLLMVGFVKPHHPFDPPYPYSTMYDPAALDLLPGYLPETPERDIQRSTGFFPHADYTVEEIRRIMALYYGTITQIDDQIARLVEILKRKGLYDNALVIYTSDHGDYMGYHHMVDKIDYMYEPVAKVPLIIKYPGGAQAGQRSRQLVTNIDLAPTILARAGLSHPESMTGRDAADLTAETPFLFAQDVDGYLVRDSRYKLLLCRKSPSLLFDLEEDPFETRNLFDDPACAPIRARLKDALADWMLFGTPRPCNVNEHAPLCGGTNPRNAFSGHRQEMEDYFREGFSHIPEKFLKK